MDRKKLSEKGWRGKVVCMRGKKVRQLAVALCAALVLGNGGYAFAGQEDGVSVSGGDLGSVSASDATPGDLDALEDFVAEDGGGIMPLSLNVEAEDAPFSLDDVGIAFQHEYQAIIVSGYGNYDCIDFDVCPEGESDFVIGSKHVKNEDLDIYYYSSYSDSWGEALYSGWEFVEFGSWTVVETGYEEDVFTIVK